MWYMVGLILITMGPILVFGLRANSGPTESIFFTLAPITSEQAARNAFDHNRLNPNLNYPDFPDKLIFNVVDTGQTDPLELIRTGENEMTKVGEVTISEEGGINQATVEIVYYPEGTYSAIIFHIPAGQKDVYLNQFDLNGKK